MRIAARAERVIAPPIVAFKDTLRALLARGDVVDLSQAVPSYAPPDPAREALAAAAADPAAARYTPDPGLPACRDATATWLTRRHGARLAAENVLLTPGANAAFHFAANVLFDPGDRVHLVSPYYFNHAMSVELLGGEVGEIRLPLDRSIESCLREGLLDVVPAGGILVVVNPSNPTGHCLERAGLEALLAWAAARSVCLVVDETYLEFFPESRAPATLLALDGWADHAIVLGTFSKSLAMTGYRVGFVAASARVVAEVLKVQDSAAVCAPHPGQLAVIAALDWPGLDDWLALHRSEIERRVDAFTSELGGRPGPFEVEARGAFFAWVRATPRTFRGAPPTESLDAPPDATSGPVTGDSTDWRLAYRVARETGVVCLPGSAFGRNEHDRLRIAVGNETPERLREAARRMQAMTVEG
jgi:aspartate/methionine/tyrosine aminotransferase